MSSEGRTELLKGTLDMLILRTLLFGAQHGHGIVLSIERTSGDVLQIDHGSLYPALHRLMKRGWIEGNWRMTENNRRAKYYELTKLGRKQLQAEASKWGRMAEAIARIMNAVPGEAAGS